VLPKKPTSSRKPIKPEPVKLVNQEPAPQAYRNAAPVVHHFMSAISKRDWDDFSALPAEGPAILVSNHLSSIDAFVLADYTVYHGRWPYFLSKNEVFNWPLFGRFMKAIDAIPVYRGTERAGEALIEAENRLAQGKVVALAPEGTTAFDPHLWPMATKTGAARLAMTTGAPVIPIGHWGASTLCPDNKGPQRVPHLIPRPWVTVRSGQPIDLGAFGTDVNDRDAVRGAATTILGGIIKQVELARGEAAPPLVYSLRTKTYVPLEEAIW